LVEKKVVKSFSRMATGIPGPSSSTSKIKIGIQDEVSSQEFQVTLLVNHPGKAPGFPIVFFPHRHAVQEDIRMNMDIHPAPEVEDLGEPSGVVVVSMAQENFMDGS
jgi:hypothetical protein